MDRVEGNWGGKLGVKVVVLGGSLDDMTNFAAISAFRGNCLFVKVKVFCGRFKIFWVWY